MKEEHLFEKLGNITARLNNVEEKLKEVPTRPELLQFTDALHSLVEIQKEQAEHIRTFNDYVNRWKGAALVLVAIGALLAKGSELFMSFWSSHTPS